MLFIILLLGLRLVMFIALVIAPYMKKFVVLAVCATLMGVFICLSITPLLGSCHLTSHLCYFGPLDHIKLNLMTGYHCRSLEFALSLEGLLLVTMA